MKSRLNLSSKKEKTDDGIYFVILKLSGMIDYEPDLSRLQNIFEEIYCTDIKIIIMEMSELLYITSVGISLLAKFTDILRKAGGDLKFVNMLPKVMVVFNMLGYSGSNIFFSIYPSERVAITSIDRLFIKNGNDKGGNVASTKRIF